MRLIIEFRFLAIRLVVGKIYNASRDDWDRTGIRVRVGNRIFPAILN